MVRSAGYVRMFACTFSVDVFEQLVNDSSGVVILIAFLYHEQCILVLQHVLR